MRTRDELKQGAIFEATVKLVNEIGFVASSVSKIAKEAGVSPATIYIYYENKEDLLISTYLEIKRKIGGFLLKDFDDSQPIRDIFKQVWMNGFHYAMEHSDYFLFTEQFANSPYTTQVDTSELEKSYAPFYGVIERGIERKVLKDVPFELLSVFIYYPMLLLPNKRLHDELELTEEVIQTAFRMAWDAIRY